LTFVEKECFGNAAWARASLLGTCHNTAACYSWRTEKSREQHLAFAAEPQNRCGPASFVRALSQSTLVILLCLLVEGLALAAAPNAPDVPLQEAPARQNTNNIVVTNVNAGFIQNGGSCVLASYAVVASYFTGKPISSYFEGYCRHFGLAFKDAADAEQKYAAHFDSEWRKRNCRGYEVILDLHSTSNEKCFVEARQIFDGRFYLDSSERIDELERVLSTQEAFLNITYEPGRDYHSITIMNDGTHFQARDTNRKGIYPIPGLRQIGKLRDSVLYIRK
jgi:hypothetical protein